MLGNFYIILKQFNWTFLVYYKVIMLCNKLKTNNERNHNDKTI